MLLVLALHVQLVVARVQGRTELIQKDVQFTQRDSGWQGSEGGEWWGCQATVTIPPPTRSLSSPTTPQHTRGRVRVPDPDRACSRYHPQWSNDEELRLILWILQMPKAMRILSRNTWHGQGSPTPLTLTSNKTESKHQKGGTH